MVVHETGRLPHAGPASGPVACEPCLRRAWLVAALAGHVEHARHDAGRRLPLLLALTDERLMRAVGAWGPELVARYEAFDPDPARAVCEAAGLTVLCRHDRSYPDGLRSLPDAPAVLHVAGRFDRFVDFTRSERCAIGVVGARRASAYGLEVARALGRDLAAAGVPVVSGMALGIDSAAHAGALAAGGPTLAVLAAGPERAYPASKAKLHAAIREHGCVVSEAPPGSRAFKWCFPARNRIIAGLSRLVVVVEAAERSGSLITAELARDAGRDVGAVPGRVTSPQAAGANALLADGAHVVRSAEDALDIACGVGTWRREKTVPGHLAALLAAVGDGCETIDSLAESGLDVTTATTGLVELELLGHVVRAPGGRFVAAA